MGVLIAMIVVGVAIGFVVYFVMKNQSKGSGRGISPSEGNREQPKK